MSTVASAFSTAKFNIVKIKELGTKSGKNKAGKAVWPNPQDSVGTYLGKISGKKYWETKGPECPVDQTFDDIWPGLNEYLESHTDPAPTIVFWSVFMVGSEPKKTVPTIIVCCEDEGYRKAVAKAIRESKILEAYPGFATAHLAEPPASNGPLVLMASSTSSGDALLFDNNKVTDSRHRVFSASTNLGCGKSILVETERAGIGERATVGGTITIFGQQYIMTAAHPFIYNAVPQTFKEQIHGNLNRTHSEYVADLRFSSIEEGDAKGELDYALIAPRPSANAGNQANPLTPVVQQLCAFPRFTKADEFKKLHGQKVCAAIEVGYRPTRIHGSISARPGFIRVPQCQGFQKVFMVKLAHMISRGVSGAWVVSDTGLGSLHGHIIAGHDKGQYAYIVPACDVFDDLNRVIGIKVAASRQSIGDQGTTSTFIEPYQSDYATRHPVSGVQWSLVSAAAQIPPDTTGDWIPPAPVASPGMPKSYPPVLETQNPSKQAALYDTIPSSQAVNPLQRLL